METKTRCIRNGHLNSIQWNAFVKPWNKQETKAQYPIFDGKSYKTNYKSFVSLDDALLIQFIVYISLQGKFTSKNISHSTEYQRDISNDKVTDGIGGFHT